MSLILGELYKNDPISKCSGQKWSNKVPKHRNIIKIIFGNLEPVNKEKAWGGDVWSQSQPGYKSLAHLIECKLICFFVAHFVSTFLE